eukprot:CAMPEP_0194370998 /NCGR_PEP_ID=MMETSP0174-20130528/19343_1 /TAXON_ID=216777 /ORGANISM="Proboscia alata, Strain PI-D3" /LENGTH=239 /DNA_ID=CAMNT_0039148777 /DNA_START=418 /DNA_END=1137 /DNA_ORIENTATION=-
MDKNLKETNNSLENLRYMNGDCPTCGIQTHHTNDRNKRTPITDEYVMRGRCLLCKPLPTSFIADSGAVPTLRPQRKAQPEITASSDAISLPITSIPDASKDDLTNPSQNTADRDSEITVRPEWQARPESTPSLDLMSLPITFIGDTSTVDLTNSSQSTADSGAALTLRPETAPSLDPISLPITSIPDASTVDRTNPSRNTANQVAPKPAKLYSPNTQTAATRPYSSILKKAVLMKESYV